MRFESPVPGDVTLVSSPPCPDCGGRGALVRELPNGWVYWRRCPCFAGAARGWGHPAVLALKRRDAFVGAVLPAAATC